MQFDKSTNTIEIYGISKDIPNNPSIFREFILEKYYTIENGLPDISKVIKLFANISSKFINTFRTNTGLSLEGQHLTGLKLLVEGSMDQTVEYISGNEYCPVNVVRFNTPFYSPVTLPSNYITCVPPIVTAFIENIYVKQLDSRNIYEATSILLDISI